MHRQGTDQPPVLAHALGERYALGTFLGRGGFAEVWQAYEPALDRSVAIKVLRSELAGSPDVVERFLREARAMARLAHQNVVQVYATGEADGLAWVAMQFVDGESLRGKLEREGALTADEARHVLDQAAAGLGAAHAAGIVHRDVKPDNILLGSDGRVLITDFGIARAQEAASRTLTGTGLVLGTPHYMSPEQGRGDSDIDHRADIYSLGVVGYQLLAGRLPFEAENPLVVLFQHASETPTSLSSLRPDAPRELVAAVERCLRKRPGDRWASAEDFRQALITLTPERGDVRDAMSERERRPVPVVTMAAGVGAAAAIAGDYMLDAGGILAICGIATAAFFAVVAFAQERLRKGDQGDDDRRVPAQRLRADRAAVLSMLSRVPRAEREALAPVRRAMEDLVARAAESELTLASAPTSDEDSNIQRAVHEQNIARFRTAGSGLRRAVRQAWSDGYARAAPEVERALASYAETVRRET
jgi:predicted Ser/Thr protein kinase